MVYGGKHSEVKGNEVISWNASMRLLLSGTEEFRHSLLLIDYSDAPAIVLFAAGLLTRTLY